MNEQSNIPKCVGIIMDGNRRWARNRNLPLLEGHRQGGETLKNTIGWARDFGIDNIIFYTFSTENWKRSEEEVTYLIDLIGKFISSHLDHFHKEGGVIHFSGDLSKFSESLQKSLNDSVEKTKNNPGPHVYFALNYGGRAEILSAVKKILKDNPSENEVTEEYFSKFLQTGSMPDPDIVVRTSGEKRLSGFLPWQSVYSELFFIDTLWPDFSKEDFSRILEEYANRDRRIGK